jgi:hypothetical protein
LGDWRVRVDGRLEGSFETQAEALRAAIDAANDAGERGLKAQVFTQGRDDQFKVVWRYGGNPFPPAI